MTTYDGNNVFPSSYTIPDDGSPRDAASVNVAFEALGDRSRYLKTRMVNGADGGSWNPISTIGIGGAGLTFGNNQVPLFDAVNSHRTRTVVQTFGQGQVAPLDLTLLGGYAVALQGEFPPSLLSVIGAEYYLALEAPHDGATLHTVKVMMQMATGRGGVPVSLPRFRVKRNDLVTAGQIPNSASEDLYSGGNVVYPTPANVGVYEATGIKGWTGTMDQNNVIDRSKYGYSIYIQDEHGTNAHDSNIFYSIILTYTNIADMRFP